MMRDRICFRDQLERADEADRFVVAINDDPSVTMLKGSGCPILRANDRAELIGALEMVDSVVLFSTSTATELLEVLRLDVHCKETDYTVDTVPERAVVRTYGGRTVIVGGPKDHSTRNLFDLITARRNVSARS